MASAQGLGRKAAKPVFGPLVTLEANFHTTATRRACRPVHCIGPGTAVGGIPNIGPSVLKGRHHRWLSTPSIIRSRQQAIDRDVIVSVLEAAATRRDAKGYLQKYTARDSRPLELQNTRRQGNCDARVQDVAEEAVNAAIVNLRLPQDLSTDMIHGIAKTLTQLRMLGLTALVIIDCGIKVDRHIVEDEALRLCEAIDSFGGPGSKLADDVFYQMETVPSSMAPCNNNSFNELAVDDRGLLKKALQRSMITVLPSTARRSGTASPTSVEGRATAHALARYLTGLPEDCITKDASLHGSQQSSQSKIASIERIIILDPAGAIPMARYPNIAHAHRFINLEQEYDPLLASLKATGPVDESNTSLEGIQDHDQAERHATNLSLARDVLTFLPHSSSALITTPQGAANRNSRGCSVQSCLADGSFRGIDSMVTTRAQKNPLLHNLLTNRPAFSPSLPLQSPQDRKRSWPQTSDPGSATLVKIGMPVTTHPDTRIRAWRPAKPGSPRLRLTDDCVDLTRLVFLIEDSFGRKLDVKDYLKRLHNNLAGVIIAGEYEGAAILTWERPAGLDEREAYEQHRLVPYLDKFAVLRSRQGSSGVADILFNAMVRDCFPGGVCWRSRKDNPVNKWYFERSVGTRQLPQSKWAMFWTTADAEERGSLLQDYEDVCRGILPSWADRKHIED